MRTLAIEAGLIYQGKLIPWEAIEDYQCGIADQKTNDKLRKKTKDLISLTPILINQNTNTKEIASILGIKIVEDDRKLLISIKKKIERFNETNSNISQRS